MIAKAPTSCICYPPAALNGGPLDTAPDKVGTWVWQPKVDDWRAVIHCPSRTVWNQYGQLSSFSDTDKFEAALDRLMSTSFAAEWLDVGMMNNRHQLMRGCIIVFDLIEKDAEQWARYARLKATFDMLPLDMAQHLGASGGCIVDRVFLINEFRYKSPKEVYAFLQAQNRQIGHKFFEGLVAKKRDSLYLFGTKPKQDCVEWIKHRFDQ